MDLWERFYKSGKVSDYLIYKLSEKEGREYDNRKGLGYSRE